MSKGMFVAREKPKEMVNHPQHYSNGNIECIDVMLQLYGKEAVLNFCLLNSFKYQWRCKMKNNCLEDLAKAKWYLDKYLEISKDEQ